MFVSTSRFNPISSTAHTSLRRPAFSNRDDLNFNKEALNDFFSEVPAENYGARYALEISIHRGTTVKLVSPDGKKIGEERLESGSGPFRTTPVIGVHHLNNKAETATVYLTNGTLAEVPYDKLSINYT